MTYEPIVSDHEEPIRTFLQLSLALNRRVGEQKGIEPLLSKATYDYGLETPSWGWETIGYKIEEMTGALRALRHSPAYALRVDFLEDILTAYAIMVREGLGEVISYGDRVSAYLQVPGERVAQHIVDALESALRRCFVEAGYPDEPAVAMEQWRKRQAIYNADLISQGHALLAEAKQRTQARVWPMPEEHEVQLFFPDNYPYRGYSDYSRDFKGRIFLNGDIHWELAGLRHLITHEAFPGHQAFSATREARYRAGLLPVEATLYFSNTPITPIVEGLCEIGQMLLGMDETIDDRIYEAYNRLSNAVSLNLAFDCNEDGMDIETATEKLMAATYVPRRFALRYCRFFTNPLWCTSFPHYWHGDEFMRACVTRMQDDLPGFFALVYTEAHTVRTMRAAVDARVARKAVNGTARSGT